MLSLSDIEGDNESDFSNYKCTICLGVFIEASSINCGHKFCHHCINKWLRSSINSVCPICREPVMMSPEVLPAVEDELALMYSTLSTRDQQTRADGVLARKEEARAELIRNPPPLSSNEEEFSYSDEYEEDGLENAGYTRVYSTVRLSDAWAILQNSEREITTAFVEALPNIYVSEFAELQNRSQARHALPGDWRNSSPSDYYDISESSIQTAFFDPRNPAIGIPSDNSGNGFVFSRVNPSHATVTQTPRTQEIENMSRTGTAPGSFQQQNAGPSGFLSHTLPQHESRVSPPVGSPGRTFREAVARENAATRPVEERPYHNQNHHQVIHHLQFPQTSHFVPTSRPATAPLATQQTDSYTQYQLNDLRASRNSLPPPPDQANYNPTVWRNPNQAIRIGAQQQTGIPLTHSLHNQFRVRQQHCPYPSNINVNVNQRNPGHTNSFTASQIPLVHIYPFPLNNQRFNPAVGQPPILPSSSGCFWSNSQQLRQQSYWPLSAGVQGMVPLPFGYNDTLQFSFGYGTTNITPFGELPYTPLIERPTFNVSQPDPVRQNVARINLSFDVIYPTH